MILFTLTNGGIRLSKPIKLTCDMRRVNNKKIAKRMQDWWKESKYKMRILPQSPTSLPYLVQAKGRRLSKSKASRRELKVGERRVHIYSNRNMYCGNAKTKGRIKKQITHWGRDQSTQEDVMYTSMKNTPFPNL